MSNTTKHRPEIEGMQNRARRALSTINAFVEHGLHEENPERLARLTEDLEASLDRIAGRST